MTKKFNITLKNQNLYTTKNNINEVVEILYKTLPSSRFNEVFTILMIYHNTLLSQLKRESNVDQ